MSTEESVCLGTMNGHSAGIIMKELVRRAIKAIRNQRQVFEVTAKKGYSGNMDDMFTSADSAAQEVYLRSLRECFPIYGIIAEEDSLTIPCRDGSGTYFTVDPLDGTKAFVRRQSHGVGTMISLSRNDVFLSAYVGDVNTEEIYGFRPFSKKVHRITEFSEFENLVDLSPQGSKYVLLRDPEKYYSPLSQRTIQKRFKNYIVDGGSIGVWLARLWKGEVGAAIIPPSMETPWDSNPVNAISQMMGFVSYKPSSNGKKWEPFKPIPIQRKVRRHHDILLIKGNL